MTTPTIIFSIAYNPSGTAVGLEAKVDGLPEMIGTPKQAEWARKIRDQKVADLTNHLIEIITRAARVPPIRREEETCPEVANLMAAIAKANTMSTEMPLIVTFLRQDSAPYWIDNRYTSGVLLCLRPGKV